MKNKRQNPTQAEVWLKAWCAVATSNSGCAPAFCTERADACLKDFSARFPVVIHINGPLPSNAGTSGQ